MDTNSLIHLIETVSKTLNAEGFEHIDLNHEGTSLTLNKKSVSTGVASPQQAVQGSVLAAAAPIQTASAPVEKSVSSVKEAPVADAAEGNFTYIESPIVGTFYNAPSPDMDAFVKVGDQVKKGQVVCIIEAMKLMNEIEAEIDGEIVEIMVSNEGPVEYGQSLFRLK